MDLSDATVALAIPPPAAPRRGRGASGVVGSVADPDDATVRIEVSVGRPRRPLEAAVIYLTKVNGREVGRQSVGMPPRVARDIAAMLQTAADEFK